MNDRDLPDAVPLVTITLPSASGLERFELVRVELRHARAVESGSQLGSEIQGRGHRARIAWFVNTGLDERSSISPASSSRSQARGAAEKMSVGLMTPP